MHDLRKDTVAYADHILSEAFYVGFYDFLKKGSGLLSVHSIGSAHWLALHSLRTGSGLLFFLDSMSLDECGQEALCLFITIFYQSCSGYRHI